MVSELGGPGCQDSVPKNICQASNIIRVFAKCAGFGAHALQIIIHVETMGLCHRVALIPFLSGHSSTSIL